MLSTLRPAIVVTLFFTLLLGLAYPLAVTGVAQLAFPFQAGGSMIQRDGKVVGSALIGQNFAAAGYLHPRPSAAGTDGYDASSSGGSNLGPLNPALTDRVKASAAALRTEAPNAPIPADAVTTSASGLDPDVSPAFADRQAARIAAARGAPVSEVRDLLSRNIVGPTFGFLGQPHVNVLKVNLALDARWPLAHSPAP